jgi:hypothetical protein
MPCGRDDKTLYVCHPNALALTISLSNSTTRDAVPAYFPPMTPPPDASAVRQINLLDITNDAVSLLRTGHYLPQGFNVLDTAQLMPFTEIRNDKFIYVIVLDFPSRHVPNLLPPTRFSIGTTFEGSSTFVFQTTLQAKYTIGIATLHASTRADGTPGRFLHDSPVMIGPTKIQNPSYESAIARIFEGRGTAIYRPPTATVPVGSKRHRRGSRAGAFKRRMQAYATSSTPTGSELAMMSGCCPALLTLSITQHMNSSTYIMLQTVITLFLITRFRNPLASQYSLSCKNTVFIRWYHRRPNCWVQDMVSSTAGHRSTQPYPPDQMRGPHRCKRMTHWTRTKEQYKNSHLTLCKVGACLLKACRNTPSRLCRWNPHAYPADCTMQGSWPLKPFRVGVCLMYSCNLCPAITVVTSIAVAISPPTPCTAAQVVSQTCPIVLCYCTKKSGMACGCGHTTTDTMHNCTRGLPKRSNCCLLLSKKGGGGVCGCGYTITDTMHKCSSVLPKLPNCCLLLS